MLAAYALVLVVAATGTYLTTFAVRRIVTRYGAVVLPGGRRIHKRALPTMGGIAMYVGFLLAMGIGSRLPEFRQVFDVSLEPLGIVLGATIILFVGVVDDLREVSPPAKLAGTVLAASALFLTGVTMTYFRIPFADFVSVTADWAPLLTVIWLVGMTTAVNWIDGLDGLAAGIVAIAAGGFFLYAFRLDQVGLLEPGNVGPLLAVIACGVCLGFLPHNFHPARIIMGDAGSLFLGLLMAASTTVVGGRTADQFSGQTFFFFAPLFIPFFILGVPMIDTAFAIARRAVRRTSLSEGDKEHLHHRLMRLGHGHRRSVLILWAWTALLSSFVLYPTFTNKGNAVVPFAAVGLGIVLYTLFHPGLRNSKVVVEADLAEAEAVADQRSADDDDGPLATVVRLDPGRAAGGG